MLLRRKTTPQVYTTCAGISERTRDTDRPVTNAEAAPCTLSIRSTRKVYVLPAYPSEYGGSVRTLGFLPVVNVSGGTSVVTAFSDTTVHEYTTLPSST